jgi:hypothetical protein
VADLAPHLIDSNGSKQFKQNPNGPASEHQSDELDLQFVPIPQHVSSASQITVHVPRRAYDCVNAEGGEAQQQQDADRYTDAFAQWKIAERTKQQAEVQKQSLKDVVPHDGFGIVGWGQAATSGERSP